MPVLIVDHQGSKRGAILSARTLIGRRTMNHLVIDDPAVSRMHCWIDRKGESFLITDMRSRGGTLVNGHPIRQQHQLVDGDVIEIGPARLTFLKTDRVPMDVESFDLPREPVVLARDMGIRFDCPTCRAPMWAATTYARRGGVCVYCGNGFTIPATTAKPPAAPPAPVLKTGNTSRFFGDFDPRLDVLQVPADTELAGAAELDAAGEPPTMAVEAAAIAPPVASVGLIEPLAEPPPMAGPLEPVSQKALGLVSAYVEESPEEAARAVAAAAARAAEQRKTAAPKPAQPKPVARCGVCQSPILPTEQKTTCPACGLHFHEECWQENYGCSAYGCSQVNALAPPEPAPAEIEDAATSHTAATVDEVVNRTPWEFILLGASAVAAIVSGVTFGGASLVTLIWSIIYLTRSRQDPHRKAGIVYGAIALSALGLLAGVGLSYLLFIYGRIRR